MIKELNLSGYNTKVYDNENDNSNVIYLKYNNYKFLFMGDVEIDKWKDILEYRTDKEDIIEITLNQNSYNIKN